MSARSSFGGQPTQYPSAVPLWNEFWKWANESQLGANVVGGIIVALLVGFVAIVPKLRRPVVSAIRRSVAFLSTVRITTTTRIEAATRSKLSVATLEPPAKSLQASAPGSRALWSLSEGRGLVFGAPAGAISYRLTNRGGVEALNVWVDTDNTRMGIASGGFWPSVPDGEAKTFVGVPTGPLGDDPLIFTVGWCEGPNEYTKELVSVGRFGFL